MKILILDIETFPNIAYVWGKYQQDVIRFKQESCIATFVAKWYDEPEIISRSLPDYKGYEPFSYDDSQLVRDLWELLDAADVVVAHNGKDFDVRVIQARFLFHGLKPPSPFKVVDTKQMAKKVGRFNSNKLDDLMQHFGEGKKIKTDFDLWQGCIEGKPESWAKMVKYNKRDVLLLEKLYKRLLPFTDSHPNRSVEAGFVCPRCGSDRLHARGTRVSATRVYQKFQCQACGGWSQAVKSEKGGAQVRAV